MEYKILIDKSGTQKLVEVPEKPVNTHDNPIEYSELWMKYQDALSAALADESKWISFKDEQYVRSLLYGDEVKKSGDQIEAMDIVNKVGQTFDLPENIGVSFLDGTTPEGYYKIAILTPKPENSAHSFTEGSEVPESVPSCGEPQDSMWMEVCVRCYGIERDGVTDVIKDLMRNFKIQRKSTH